MIDTKIGNIYLYRDYDYLGKAEKIRPCIFIKDTMGDAFVGIKLTSRLREYDQFSYEMQEWKNAGLKKPSSARCDKPIIITNALLFNDANSKVVCIGKASKKDLENISCAFTKYCEQLNSIAKQLSESVHGLKMYYVQEKYWNNGKTHNAGSPILFDDEASASKYVSKYQSTRQNVLIDGKACVVATGCEFGTIMLQEDGTYKNSDLKPLYTRNPTMTKTERSIK